jgi:type II secretion system protein N
VSGREAAGEARGAAWLPASPALRGGLAAALALALVLLFVALGFPYARLAPALTGLLQRATGARVRIASVGPGLSWTGPRLVARGVELAWPGGYRLPLDRLSVGLAPSFAWLRGVPALAVSVESDLGELDGTARISDTPGFDGEVRELALDRLPPGMLGATARFTGVLDADLDLDMTGQELAGRVRFRARDGSLSMAELPIGVPFAAFDGDIELGGDALARVDSLVLDGPMIGASATGTVGHSAIVELAPLQIELQIEAHDPSVRNLLRSQNVALNDDGSGHLKVVGTLSAPKLQAGRPAPRRPSPS